MKPTAKVGLLPKTRLHGVMALSLFALLPMASCGGSDGSDSGAEDAAGSEADLSGATVGVPAPADVPREGADRPFEEGPELWLASFASPEDPMEALPQLGVGRNVTERAGYDNQPEFAPDGTILYTLGVGDRTDIWRYDPVSDTHRPVVETDDQSEYSPTPIPGANAISIIRVEPDSAQRLWRIDLGPDGVAVGESVILPDIDPVGYHAWANDSTLGLFVLGDPATLQAARPGPGAGEVLDEGIGRGIERLPAEGMREGDWLSYTTGAPDGSGRILHPTDLSGPPNERIGDFTLPTEDHAWTPGGVLVFGDGATLMGWRPGIDEAPRPIGTLPDEAMSISRLAVSPDGTRIVLVVERAGG